MKPRTPGTRPDDPTATGRIFEAKRREHDLALPVLVPTIEFARDVARLDAGAERLAQAFWPGALTLVLPRSDIQITETGSRNIAMLEPNVSLSQLITGLNALGVSPQEMADIIRAMKTAGAIHAELVIR